MAKVAKNIKRLRNAKGFSQEQLAERLHISRQAVSHWENDRTQPDIDMLEKLAEVLGAPIEEIIYGEKRQTSLEPDRKKPLNTAAIILAVLGSLFVATGLIFVFVTGWKNFPVHVKTVFAFVPILAGQFCAAFVYKKKANLIPWREGACVLWCAGIVATIAMINSIYDIHCGYENCLMIDGIMFLPAIYLFGAAVPLAAYFYAVIHWGIYRYEISSDMLTLALIFLLFAVGLLYLYIHRKEKEEPTFKFALWASSVSAAAFIGIFSTLSTGFLTEAPLLACMAVFTAFDKNDKDYSVPFKSLRLLGTIGVCIFSRSAIYSTYSYDDLADTLYFYIFWIIAITLVTVLCIFAARKNFRENLFNKITITILCLWSAMELLIPFVSAEKNDAATSALLGVFWLFTVAISVNLILGGVRHSDFLEMNSGLILILYNVGYLVFVADLGMLLNGLVLIVLGAVLLAVNFALSRTVKEMAKKEKGGEEDA